MNQIIEAFKKQDLGSLLFLTANPVENFFPKESFAKKNRDIYRGIYIAKTEDIMGLGSFKKTVTRKAFGEENIEFIEIGKFLKDCLDGDMEALNILTAENIIYNTNEDLYDFYSNLRNDARLFFSRNINNKTTKNLAPYLTRHPETWYVFDYHADMLTYVLQTIYLNARFDVSGTAVMGANTLKNIIDLDRSLEFHSIKVGLSKVIKIATDDIMKFPEAVASIVKDLKEAFEKSKERSELPIFPTNKNTIEKDLIAFRIALSGKGF